MVKVSVKILVGTLVVAPLLACGSSAPLPPGGTVEPVPGEASSAPDRNEQLLRLASQVSADSTAAVAEYRVGPDDVLDIRVFDAPDLSGEFRVAGDGTVSIPLLGALSVGGHTPAGVEGILTDTLAASYMRDPTVTVQVAEMGSHGVSVVGAVRVPGVFQIGSSITLLEALARAEGLAEDAGERVLVVRRGAELEGPASSSPDDVVVVNLARLLDGSRPEGNVLVHPGDIVQVQHTGVVYVVGQVNNPGGFPIGSRERLTILQAVALAGGTTRTADEADARIVRTDETGQRTEIPVHLDEVLNGEKSNLVLQSTDVVFIPNSTAKSVARGAWDAFVRMMTLRGLFGG